MSAIKSGSSAARQRAGLETLFDAGLLPVRSDYGVVRATQDGYLSTYSGDMPSIPTPRCSAD
jgi:hypothetical protein